MHCISAISVYQLRFVNETAIYIPIIGTHKSFAKISIIKNADFSVFYYECYFALVFSL